MAQEPLPPPYTSSKIVLNGIGAAFSTFNNPRGLESLWNGPFGETLHELVSSYTQGQFLVYSPYNLWLPGLVRKEQLLRAEFAELTLEYDIPPTLHTGRMSAKAHLKTLNGIQPSRQPVFSNRICAQKKKTKELTEKEVDEHVRVLLLRRRDLVAKQKELAQKQKNILGPDDSIESNPDSASFEEEPDLFVAHVASVVLPLEDHYALRGFRKPYYQRGAMLAELKKGPTCQLQGDAYEYASLTHIYEAIDDLIDYCSAYFACYPDSESVIALATGGPMWKWANIKRSDLPRWDFMLNTANRTSATNKLLVAKWPGLFGIAKQRLFRLGSSQSDAQLTLINQQYLHPLLAHTPPVPDYLHSREGETGRLEDEDPDLEDEDLGDIDDLDEEPEEWRGDRGLWPDDI